MSLSVQPVAAVLAEVGLKEPELNALVPNVDNYEVLLLQPQGDIECDDLGVRNRNRALADKQYGGFLADALSCRADLAITPEYSMPWTTLRQSIEAGHVPETGKLWALGCESIKYSELQRLQADLKPYAELLFEPMQPDPKRFVDPLAYVFRTTDVHGAQKVVILVQFKICAMGDRQHYELNLVQRGTKVYQFGGMGTTKIRLFSLICADAFEVGDSDAKEMYERALIIHIQLNQSPRHSQYRQYRERLMKYHGDETEILCLNWAENVVEWEGGQPNQWHNISGSAWYLKPQEFDVADATLQKNHRQGLYYTWHKDLHIHVLFFNYKPATFLLTATKVAHLAVIGSLSRRVGPKLDRICQWDTASEAWVAQPAADDGFATLLPITGASAGAQKAFTVLEQRDVFAAERVLALAVGEFGDGIDTDWHKVTRLDACRLPESEEIQRVTFCQDPAANNFRVSRLQRGGLLWNHLQSEANLPAALKDLQSGFEFTWSDLSPNQNLISKSNLKAATVIYLGEGKTRRQAEEIASRTSDLLRRSISREDTSHTARQRLAVWYRDGEGTLQLCDPHPLQSFDDAGEESPVDIGRDR